MFKKIFLCTLVIATAISGPMAFAEKEEGGSWLGDWLGVGNEMGGKLNIGVTCSAVFPKFDAFETGVNVEGLISYDLLKWLAIGVEGGYTTYEFKSNGINIGTVHEFPLLGDVILKWPLEYKEIGFVPYLVNGFGTAFTDVKESGIAKQWGSEYKTRPAFLYKLGGGFDLFLTRSKWVALNFEASYQWGGFDWDSVYSPNGDIFYTSKKMADAAYLGGGLKFRF